LIFSQQKGQVMKHIKFIGCSLAVLLFFAVGCSPKESATEKQIKEALPKLDEMAGTFNPSTEVKPESAHRGITVMVGADGTLQLDSASVNSPIRKGRLPYALDREQKSTQLFTVSWFDANNNRLGSYSIESPLTLRTCEEGREDVKVMSAGTFEVLLPTDRSISSFQMANQGKVVGDFKLR